jgi:hypothetical protein
VEIAKKTLTVTSSDKPEKLRQFFYGRDGEVENEGRLNLIVMDNFRFQITGFAGAIALLDS